MQGKLVILRKKITGLSPSTLERFVLRARRAVHLRDSVNVLVTNSHELRSLNRQFRGKDKATDVLSFPSPQLETASMPNKLLVSWRSPLTSHERTPVAWGTPSAEEIKILVLHGILHLAGFDHERDNGEMAHEETRLRQLLKLEMGLIERTEARASQHLSRKSPRIRPSRARRRTV